MKLLERIRPLDQLFPNEYKASRFLLTLVVTLVSSPKSGISTFAVTIYKKK